MFKVREQRQQNSVALTGQDISKLCTFVVSPTKPYKSGHEQIKKFLNSFGMIKWIKLVEIIMLFQDFENSGFKLTQQAPLVRSLQKSSGSKKSSLRGEDVLKVSVKA